MIGKPAESGLSGGPRSVLSTQKSLQPKQETPTRSPTAFAVKKKTETKFDFKIRLVKMDVFVSKECIIKVRLRSEGIFKLNSKKYRVSPPYGHIEGSKTFQSFIEFQTDIFKKVIIISKGADGKY